MDALAVVAFCMLLLLFMRAVGAVFGSSCGTFAGIGCVGLIGATAVLSFIAFLLPFLVPATVAILVVYGFYKAFRTASTR